jgi:hypothetical protein
VGRGGSLLVGARPKALDAIAVAVDPVWAGHRRLVAFWWARGSCPHVLDGLAKAVTRLITVSEHPLRYAWQATQRRNGIGQFMRRTWRKAEWDSVLRCACDHASPDPIGATCRLVTADESPSVSASAVGPSRAFEMACLTCSCSLELPATGRPCPRDLACDLGQGQPRERQPVRFPALPRPRLHQAHV